MIDTHLHVWQLGRGWYGWNTPELGPLHSDSALVDIADELVTAGVGSAMLVQAADQLAETDWLLGLAEQDPLSGWAPAELEAVYRGTAERVYRRLEPS